MRIPTLGLLASTALLAGASPLQAQTTSRALVAVHDPLAPQGRAAIVLSSPLGPGLPLDLGRFASDVFAPEAIAWDPIAREIVLALREASASRFVRLEWNGSAITSERFLGRVTDRVEALAIGSAGDVYAATLNGIWRVPRLGGTPVLVLPHRAATALELYPGSDYGIVANGREVATFTEPGLAWVDLRQGTITSGPWQFPTFAGSKITGVVDLPTGVPREVLSDDLGQITMSVGFQDPQLVGVTPQRGPGTTVAMHAESSFEPVVLGGAAHPYLESFVAFYQPNPVWTPLGGPFPGDPQDFCFLPAPIADAVPFGSACGPGNPQLYAPFPPALGSSNFALHVSGFDLQVPYLLALSPSDRSYFGVPLPLEVTPGCLLYVGLEALVVAQTDASGNGSVTLPIPRWPFLADAGVYAQALQLVPPMRFSPGLALHLR